MPNKKYIVVKGFHTLDVGHQAKPHKLLFVLSLTCLCSSFNHYCTAPRYPDPFGPWDQAQQHGPHLQPLSTLPSQTTSPSFIIWSLLGITFPYNKERLKFEHTIACLTIPKKHRYRAFLLELEPSSKATFATFHPHLTTHLQLMILDPQLH